MRFIRFCLFVFLIVVAVDYVRDNFPGWGHFLKVPLPPLPPEIADMIGDRAEDLAKQADEVRKKVEAYVRNPPLPPDLIGKGEPIPPGPAELTKAAEELGDKLKNVEQKARSEAEKRKKELEERARKPFG